MPYELPKIFDNARPKPPDPEPEPEKPKGPPGKAPDPNDVEKYQSYELYLLGWQPKDIERECGIEARKISNWAYIGRWNERKDYYDALKSLRMPEEKKPIIQAVITANRDQRRKDFLEHTGQMAVKDAKHWVHMTPDERLAVASEIAALNKVARDNLSLNEESSENTKGHISLTFLTNADSEGMVKLIDTEKVRQLPDKND